MELGFCKMERRTKMKYLIIVVLVLGLGVNIVEGVEDVETLYNQIEATKHKVHIHGLLNIHAIVDLDYCDLMVFAEETAVNDWLKTISAWDFLNKHCTTLYTDIDVIEELK